MVNTYVSTGPYTVVPPGENVAAHAYCETGDAASGGGHYHMRGALSHPSSSFPIVDETGLVGWTTFFYNDSIDEPSAMAPMVICLDLNP